MKLLVAGVAVIVAAVLLYPWVRMALSRNDDIDE